MDKEQLDVTILLPCYNEEDGLSVVVKGIREAMRSEKYSYEILVVDDKSTDNSAAIAEELGCRVIRRSVQGGAGAARKAGILNAYGDIIVMLDMDGSYTPGDIPKILKHFPGYDQVNGARMNEEGTLPWLRSPAKWAIGRLASYLAQYDIPDLNTGLKAFKRNIMLQYLWVIPDGFSCVTSMTLSFLCNGHSILYVPTKYNKRIGRSKFNPVKDTYAYILTVLRLITYFNPLRVYLPMAFIFLIGGILKAVIDFIFVIQRMQLSTIILIITGVIIGFQGLLADLIVAQSRAKNYMAQKNDE